MEEKTLRELLEGREEPCVLSCKAHAPYSGCWWEPNYWLFKEGEVYPIYVSGKAYEWCGFDKMHEAWQIIMHGTIADAFVEVMERGDHYDTWELEEIDEIDPNPNNLNSMTVILSSHELPGPLWRCHYCGEAHRGLAKFLGYEGNGGIGIWLSMPTCDECFYKLRTCTRCYFTVMPEEDGTCPSFGCQNLDEGEEPGEMVELSPEEDDEARKFGLDGSKFLAPGEAPGPPPVIIIMQKGEGDG